MQLDHFLFRAHDMAKMATFFEQVLRLKEGLRPPFPFPGKWFYGDQQQPFIHLVEQSPHTQAQAEYLGSAQTASMSTSNIDHIAFRGDDYPGLIARLEHFGVRYVERDVPISNEHQVFIFAPESLKIEVLFPRHINSLVQ
ncbi:lactoylglutathione lyase [Pseudoalteromonas piscicida]|uniref:lactoylglutathione lyase n=1 Tax=Pseudoalteromonas TaxID=53246 RepID=UPI001D0A0270|nr:MULTISPECIES: lactoylglutathione lyase [Pseudoalteromonas]MCG7554511.1 lactoylglutathione lyase [Pseudoalteromonas sp. Of11M-6]UDM62334.1 lactoylglutathione lyase [Pseudoalteromonas piscicida]